MLVLLDSDQLAIRVFPVIEHMFTFVRGLAYRDFNSEAMEFS